MTPASVLQNCRVGGVSYLNTRPLIFGIEPQVRLDHPSQLAAELFHGKLDAALVPVYEALRHPGDYLAVDGIGIATQGEVFSVALAYVGKLEEVRQIELDPASLTSSNLLRILFAEFLQQPVAYGVWDRVAAPEAGRAVLMIGDQAIRFRFANPNLGYLDLGEAWQRFTGLPFVFALWLLRSEISQAPEIAAALRSTLVRGLDHLEEICRRSTDYPEEFVRKYLGGYVRFHVGDSEKQAVAEYGRLLTKHALIPDERPSLTWI